MFYSVKKIWKPQIFQGHNRKDHYFEGWYYKLVDGEQKQVIALIPGIALHEKKSDSHAFIQVFNSASSTAQYHRYPLSSFTASKTGLDVKIGQSRFAADSIELNIDTEEGRVSGNIGLSDFTPWPVRCFRPGFMGWYEFVPFMQCYHAVVSFDHPISGTIYLGDTSISLKNGRGYVEKDWGTSFPQAWIWMQSNHFEEKAASFMCSLATIPWLGSYFTGFGAGFWYRNKLYPFTKWNGSRVENLTVTDKKTSFSLIHTHHRIDITATGEEAGELRSPVFGEMAGKVLESLKGEIEIVFSCFENGKWKEEYSGIGRNGGLEIMGDMNKLIKGF